MPLPSSINDLSQTAGSNSPAGSESPSLIDDYLRTYASYIAQLRDSAQGNAFNYAVAGGTANAITANYSPATTTLTDSTVLLIKATSTNTGATTFSPNGITAKPVVGLANTALQGGEIIANGVACLQYNTSLGAGSWVLLYCSGGGLQVAAATQSLHAMQLGQAVGRLLNVRTITASGTYTPTTGATRAVVEAVGGGGGGGGMAATGAGAAGSAGGGAGGTYGLLYIASGLASVTVTIGAGGNGGVGGAGGTAGGTTSFGGLMSCPGGNGGNSGAGVTVASVTASPGSSGGPASGGATVSVNGAGACPGLALSSSSVLSGAGGACAFGLGGTPVGLNATSGSNGNSATGNGAGGSGAAAVATGAGVVGGAGSAGIVLIYEYA